MSCTSNTKRSHNETLMHLILLMSEYLLRVECALEGDDEGVGIRPNPEVAQMVRMAQRMAQRASDIIPYCGEKHCPHWSGRADDVKPHSDRDHDYYDDSDDRYHDDDEAPNDTY